MSLDVFLEKEIIANVFEQNITHNLSDMAAAAGIYMHLWRPDELGINTASELVEPLQEGLDRLKSDPEFYKQHNPINGWGDYENLVDFVSRYIEGCKEYPDAKVSVSR